MKKFEKNLERWAKESVPDVLDKVLEQKGMPTPQKPPRSRRLGRLVPLLMLPIIAVLALMLTPSEDLEASSVYLDFETAIEIQVDEENRILDLIGDNVSGQAFVQILKENPDWENADLDEFLPVLFETAQMRGYIQAESPVLVGTMADEMARKDELKAMVIARMQNLPMQAKPFGEIYDPASESMEASENPEMTGRMSMMRWTLIDQIMDADSTYTLETLEPLSLGELIALSQSLDVDVNMHPRMRP